LNNIAVITQNDESKWNDVKGDVYHYPVMYRNILQPGCKVVYYTGGLRKKGYEANRLSAEPHYFGIGLVGPSIADTSSSKNLYCEILEYRPFLNAVPIKVDGHYVEEIPPTKKANYWRSGVRRISLRTYAAIVDQAELDDYRPSLPDDRLEFESYSKSEGNKKIRFSSYYERIPIHRVRAIEIHGSICMACGFDFARTYGARGKGFIHVHHNKPLSESGPTVVNPKTDMSVLCANCHAMIHREKNSTLTVGELRELLRANTSLDNKSDRL
jgi:predicted HNH restriction endonuclease